jgi:hypothetical protein
MSKNKKSFLLYCDLIHTVDQLTNEQAGDLFKHILRYVNDQEPQTDNVITRIAFEPIKQSLMRDLVKYKSICERNSDNAKKRWDATASDGIRPLTKNADSDSDSDSDSDNVKEEYKLSFDLWLKYKKEKKQRYTRTGIEQLIKSCQSKYTPKEFTEVVEHSITQNYSGLYAPKDFDKNKTIEIINNKNKFNLKDYDERA